MSTKINSSRSGKKGSFGKLKTGLSIPRRFTKKGADPLKTTTYELRTSRITNPDGSVVFEMKNVEVPSNWTQVATDILAQKYFRKKGVPTEIGGGRNGSEWSAKQVMRRLAGTWRYWGEKYGYFASKEDAQTFEDEMKYMLIHQMGAPNSPQWFNTGLAWAYGITGEAQGHYYVDPDDGEIKKSTDAYTHPQPHACGRWDTKISTEEGVLNLGSIVENNRVGLRIYDGERWAKILAVKENGIRSLYRMTLGNGQYIEFTDDHLVWAAEKRKKEGGSYGWTPLRQCLGKRVQLISIPVEQKITVNVPVAEAALAGFHIGDGYHGTYKGITHFGVATNDTDEFSHVTSLFEEIFGGYTVTEKPKVGPDYKIVRRDFNYTMLFAERYGLGLGSHMLRIHDSIFQASDEAKKAFLRGLFQADGCVRIRQRGATKSGDVCLTTTSEGLAHDVQTLLMHLGIYSRISYCRDKRQNHAMQYHVEIAYASERTKFECEIGFISSRKNEKLNELNRIVNGKAKPDASEEKVVSIEYIGDEVVYDIQTESGKFLANGIVVHNCFIQSIKDDLVNEGGIFDLMTREARLFKYGSGTGSNFSQIRGKSEHLSGGGKSSGLMSFLATIDRAAGAIKSGGTTRRAAKMVCLDIDHPEVEDFINWKVIEEQKVAALHAGSYICYEHLRRILSCAHEKGIDPAQNPELKKLIRAAHETHIPLNYIKRVLMLASQGVQPEDFDFRTYDTDFRSEAYLTVSGQNSNNSLRITNEFLKAVENDEPWHLMNRVDKKIAKTVSAKKLWGAISYAAWACADPGIQFDTTINEWHTCPTDGRINASNPCVTGDTLVATADGFRQIADLVEKEVEIFDPLGEKQKVDAVFKTGFKPVYELKTASGYRLKVTADHLIFTDNRGFVPAAHLCPSDEIRIGPAGCFGNQTLETRFAEGLGLAVGDGCITGKQEMLFITLDKKEKSLAESFNEYFNSYKNDRAVDRRSARPTAVAETSTTARINTASRIVVEKMEQYAVLGRGSEEKQFTDAIYDLDQNSIAAVLRGLFTADGTVGNYGEKSQYVALDSCSLKLLQQVQLLLLQFGIKAKIYENRRAGKTTAFLPDGRGGSKSYEVKEMHSLRVSRFSRNIFEETIGFIEGTKKNAALKKMNERISCYKDTFTDHFESLAPLGEEDVYDLTEPTRHAFFANGLLVHNCSEYMFLDDTACNLASINLAKFYDPKTSTLDTEALKHASRLWTIVLEISVLMAQFPSKEIAQKSYEFRTLGLGYANLGTILMQMGIPYSSEEAYAICGAVTAILCGQSYATSAELAKALGPFFKYACNKKSMLRVIKNHRRAAHNAAKKEYEGLTAIPHGIQEKYAPEYLLKTAKGCWDEALSLGEKYGYRNAQVTVIAPTGCLTGNSLIATDNGLVRLRTLGNPNGKKWQDKNFYVLTDKGKRPVTKFFVNGAAQTRTIRTASGYEIQGTLQHRIKVVDANTGEWKWKYFAEINKGDILPLALDQLLGKPREIILPPLGDLHWNVTSSLTTPRTVTPELAELIGYFMGDGSLHSKGIRLCVSREDTDVTARLQAIIRQIFGVESVLSSKKGYIEIALHSVPLTIWWEACGFAKKLPHDDHTGKGYTPYIPDAILYSNDETIYSAFLRGLFEADGTIATGAPSLTTASAEFANEIRSLLLAIGFPTTTKLDVSGWGKSALYALRLKNKSYNIHFAEQIGFMGRRKNFAIDTIDTETEQASRKDNIYLEPALVASLADAFPPARNAASLVMQRKGALSRRLATLLFQQTESEALEKALSFFYDAVAANEDGGEQLTYDLSVPSNTTYIANGFVSHNTIGLVMDCDTTGIEPDFALVKFKKLVGGGYMKIVNQSVSKALKALNYTDAQIEDIENFLKGRGTLNECPHINEKSLRERGFTEKELLAVETQLASIFDLRFAFNRFVLGDEFCRNALGFTDEILADPKLDILNLLGFTPEQIEAANEYVCGTMTIEGAPHLKEIHYPIFDCANRCGKKGKRFIPWEAHLRMMGAAQPFISGAISKTINMPEDSTLEDVQKAYRLSWKYMLKAVALYRDGSKLSQPLNTSASDPTYAALFQFDAEDADETIDAKKLQETMAAQAAARPIRRKLPAERHSITHKFVVANHEGYLTIGLYDEGAPGEIFIKMSKEGSTLSGIMDAFALTISLCLQYGVPLEVLVAKFCHSRFEPSGMTGNRNIPLVKSIVDYIGRYLALKFLPKEIAKKYHNEELIERAYAETNPVHLQKLPSELPAAPEVKGYKENRPHGAPASAGAAIRTKAQLEKAQTNLVLALNNEDAPMCGTCGIVMIRNGACYKCLECGETSGCS